MSRWVPEELFNKFKKEVQEEELKRSQDTRGILWDKLERGPKNQPKKYTVRLLPDKNGVLYKKISYHMFQVNDKWHYIVCPKTFDPEAYCPIDSVTMKLYKGSESDKKEAQLYKRKEKFITNLYVIDDPRDADRDDDMKASGKVKLYEFPSKVESKIRDGLFDSESGVGTAGYDPGENGIDFYIKVGSTDKDGNGKDWPDYSLSAFSRKSYALADSDEEIEKIMDQVYDLDAYLRKQLKSEEDVIEILKAAYVYPLIKEDYEKMRKISNKSSNAEDIQTKQTQVTSSENHVDNEEELETKKERVDDFKTEEDSDIEDIDKELLESLNNL